MKKLLLSFSMIVATISLNAQTAPNFTAMDCLGNNHDLYTELNSGKIIVITWVMPCGSCINGAQFAQGAVQSFSASNPNTVYHYVADDYANTSCGSLASWCTTNGVTPDARFSSSLVTMTGYGTAGMPKVVVLGGTSHTIYYNVNNAAITQANITTAINNALAANATGVSEITPGTFSVKLFPNPVKNELTVTLYVKESGNMMFEVYNMTGQKVKVTEKTVSTGNNEIKLNVDGLSNGNYFLKLADGSVSEMVRFTISQ